MKALAFVICAALIPSLACEYFPGEVEGTLKFEDCRQQFQVKADDLRIAAKQFTCSTQRTGSGAVMRATCVHAETHWMSGVCETAYVYQKTAATQCPSASPWLGYDDMCHAEYETGYVFADIAK